MEEQTLDDRLWAVGWTVTESGCWEWGGPRNEAGYGIFTAAALGFRGAMAHRVMYERHVGPIPDGLLVRHRCDNPPCVNPDHLIPGTNLDNSRDMVERRRQRTRNEDLVERARDLVSEGMSRAEISELLGVSERTLSRWVGRPVGRPANGTSRWADRRRREREETGGTA
jgi:HNH endonuclease/Homeodomain-like domain